MGSGGAAPGIGSVDRRSTGDADDRDHAARRVRRGGRRACPSTSAPGRAVTPRPLVKMLALAPGDGCTASRSSTCCGPTTRSTRPRPSCTRPRTSPAGRSACPTRVVLRGDDGPALPRRRRDRRRRRASRSWPAGRSPTADADRRPPGARRSTAVSCCPRTATRSGPRSAGSSSGCATSTCCASTGAGRRCVELDPSDEVAHLALMRRHAANGDRHAALRQFERLDRALRRELGVAPGREARALRDRLLAAHDATRAGDPTTSWSAGTASWPSIERALLDAAAGRSRTLIVSGPAGHRQVVAARRGRRARAEELGLPRRPRHVGARSRGRGRTPRWSRRSPTCAVATRRCSTASPTTTARRSTGPSPAPRSRGPAAARTSGCSSPPPSSSGWPSATNGLLLTIDDVHDADDASLRLLHYLARSTRDQRVCIVLAHRPAPHDRTPCVETRQSLLDRHGAVDLELGPLDDDDVAALVRRHVAEPDAGRRRPDRRARPRHPVRRRTSWPAGPPTSRAGCRRSTPT